MVQIAPSLLAADFACLGQEVQRITVAGADAVHLDIMDNHFVPNLTFGPDTVRCIRDKTDLPFDVHLMTDKPHLLIEPFAKAGADWITFHIESDTDIENTIALIKKHGCRAGLSLKPATSVSRLIPFLPMIDLVLVMSVEPGFGGQKFQKEALARIAELRDLIGHKQVKISVDGGITDVTAPACRLAGANILVAGNFIFCAANVQEAIERLKQ